MPMVMFVAAVLSKQEKSFFVPLKKIIEMHGSKCGVVNGLVVCYVVGITQKIIIMVKYGRIG